jgi:MoaA/NifB/PqqE/SkfB family radical SAM enzyme
MIPIPLTVVNHSSHNTVPILQEQSFLPAAYQLPHGVERASTLSHSPSVVFIEVSNYCNLLCKTCPRTFFQREPLKSLSYNEFVAIAEQFPNMQRASLHGIGEPLLNRDLPQIIRYLKDRDIEVVINSNGTLLTPKWQQALIDSRLDQYRCSIDGARPETFARIRGADLLHKIQAGLTGLMVRKKEQKAEMPFVSLWCVGTRENLAELPELLRLAAALGVPEVYLQRMTYFAQEPDKQFGMAREELAIFGQQAEWEEAVISQCEELSERLGIEFRAAGARNPRNSLAAALPSDAAPWQACMRPWTTAYVTANGNCLPCCISPFATSDYPSLILGNLWERPFAEIWNDYIYQQFRTKLLSDTPHKACANCGVYWSL